MTHRLSELDEWKQAASVEAGLRREYYDKAERRGDALEALYNWVKQSNDWRPDSALARKVRDALNQ